MHRGQTACIVLRFRPMEFSQPQPLGVLGNAIGRRRFVIATLLDGAGNAFYGILP